MARVALHTLGCKLNFAETSSLGGQFLDRGYELVQLGEPADVVLLNTCSVTERADRECRQLIRRALRISPDAFVLVTGCYAQLAPEQVASIDGVDLVLGTKEKFSIFEFAGRFQKNRAPRVCVSEVGTADTFSPALSTAAGDRTRGYLKVQDGCDYHCSFCTIPLARGESRSQSIAESVRQAKQLVRQGFKEIVLTGVNVGDYGRKQGDDLLGLLRQLVGVAGLHRIRISSIEPNLLTTDLLDFIAQRQVICKHFHIPLQSGSDAVLRRMRRRYTTGQYADLVHRVRERFPESGIGADVIVGFPGETHEEFQETYRFLTELPVSYLHVFTYSERPHTPAAALPEQVVAQERSSRNTMLRMLSERKRMAWCRSMVGKSVKVLTESAIEEGWRYGFTDAFLRVGVDAGTARENTLVSVRITEAHQERCLGVVEEIIG
jgi:threonylcarbamoyladenosine tRNA methylthiotransferase MtaB